MKRRIARVVVDYDVEQPLSICGHGPYERLWPWDPRVKKIKAAAKRKGIDPQVFCVNCRKHVPFYAYPPHGRSRYE